MHDHVSSTQRLDKIERLPQPIIYHLAHLRVAWHQRQPHEGAMYTHAPSVTVEYALRLGHQRLPVTIQNGGIERILNFEVALLCFEPIGILGEGCNR